MKINTGRYILSILVISFLSCKNNSDNNGEKDKDRALYEDQLLIELNLTVLKDDVFEVYFRNKGERYDAIKSRKQFGRIGRSGSSRRKQVITGKKESQKIVFGLNQHEYPYNLRLDFGNNAKQEEIQIQSIVLLYNEGRHEFSNEELKNHFSPNKYLDINFETMLLKTYVVDNKYDPYLQSNNISAFVNKLILY